MSKINNGGPAFPVPLTDEQEARWNNSDFGNANGMTLRQYAAIKLRVPESGTDWLDEMIRKSVRDEVAEKVMQSFMTHAGPGDEGFDWEAKAAYRAAAAMLRAREAA